MRWRRASGGGLKNNRRARLDTAPHPMRKKFLFHEKVNLPQQGQTIAAQGFWHFSGNNFGNNFSNTLRLIWARANAASTWLRE